MKKTAILKKLMAILLVLAMAMTALLPIGCGGDKPEETTPSETTNEPTPDESTPPATPESSVTEPTPEGPDPEESTPVQTDPPSDPLPEEGTTYSITYILDGGINADENPDSYAYLGEEITLFVPIKKGYAFAGWTGTDLDTATEKVTITSGEYGDKIYTATWKEVGNVYDEMDMTETPPSETTGDPDEPFIPDAFVGNKDSNNGIAVNPDGTPLSKADIFSDNGSGLFLARTAYTNIDVDGIMDNAYTYGLHFELDLPQDREGHKKYNSNYDAYLVMGQDGKMHVYVKVVDPQIVINDEQWAAHWWHCDVWQMYIDYNNTKGKHDYVWSFAAEGTRKYLQNNPENWIVVMTDDGFAIEYEFDNNGAPFEPGDEFGFSFFYNDSWDYVNTSSYGRSNTRTGSVLEPATGKYVGPNPATQDGIVITSYAIDYEGEIIPDEKDEDNIDPADRNKILYELATRKKDMCVAYTNNSSAHLAITAERLAATISSLGILTDLGKESEVTNPAKFDCVLYMNYLSDGDSVEWAKELHYAEYGVKIVDNKIIAIGWQAGSTTAVAEMVEAILSYAVSGGDVTLVGTYTEELPGIPGENVPKVEGAQWITDSGDDAYVVHKLDTVDEDYDSYKALLEAAGYKLHVENVVATVKNATYYNDDTVINVLYSTADRDLRVSIEPMYNTALPALTPETYEPTSESSITMLNPNNLTLIVRLDNGEFIVIDSGNRHDDGYIYNELKKQNESDGPVVIAAWIFTHFHQDHIGGFIDYTLNEDYMENTVIKSVIYNFPEKQVLDTASRKDQINLAIFPTCIEICKKQGATIYQVRTGQKYYFGNAVVEILGTYDDIMPFFVRNDNTNHTCIIFCIDIEGQRIMVTGDATTPEFNVCAARYGDYLKSDILQLSHHGMGDGSKDTTFYEKVNAPVVLIPGSVASNAQEWAKNNAKEYYFRVNGTKTLILPHTVAE